MREYLVQMSGFALSNFGSAVLGGIVAWALIKRTLRKSAPASAVAGYDPQGHGEGTVEVRTSDPESEAVAAALKGEPETAVLPKVIGTGMRPVSESQRLDLLDGETVRVFLAGVRVKDGKATEAPYAWLTRNGNPDRDRACLTRTQEMGRVSG